MAVTAQMTVSLDGCYAGPRAAGSDDWTESPEAAGFFRITRWVLSAMSWRERLGFDGGEQNRDSEILDCRDTARTLADAVADVGPFALASDGSETPVLAFRRAVRDEGGGGGPARDWTVYDVADRLRTRGWQVPAYPMPPAIEDVSVLRIVVRNGFGHDLASRLVDDLRRAVADLEADGGRAGAVRPSLHH